MVPFLITAARMTDSFLSWKRLLLFATKVHTHM